MSKYIQSFYQYPVTFSSIGKTVPARGALGPMKNIAEVSDKEFERLQNAEPMFRELVNKQKYRVLNHIPASYITANEQVNKAKAEAEELRKKNEELQAKLAALEAGKDQDGTDAETTENADGIKALSYDDLKARATELGIEFKANVKKADLIKMIEDALTTAE